MYHVTKINKVDRFLYKVTIRRSILKEVNEKQE